MTTREATAVVEALEAFFTSYLSLVAPENVPGERAKLRQDAINTLVYASPTWEGHDE